MAGKEMKMINLGDRVKDKISGLTGIVTGVHQWLYGCRRLTVQPESSHEGKPVEAFCIDDPQATLIKTDVVVPRPKPTHGPRQDPKRY